METTSAVPTSTDATTSPQTPIPAPAAEEEGQQRTVKVRDIKIDTQADAVNVLAGFVNLAQQRGAYNLEEAAKIWDALKMLSSTAMGPPPPRAKTQAKPQAKIASKTKTATKTADSSVADTPW